MNSPSWIDNVELACLPAEIVLLDDLPYTKTIVDRAILDGAQQILGMDLIESGKVTLPEVKHLTTVAEAIAYYRGLVDQQLPDAEFQDLPPLVLGLELYHNGLNEHGIDFLRVLQQTDLRIPIAIFSGNHAERYHLPVIKGIYNAQRLEDENHRAPIVFVPKTGNPKKDVNLFLSLMFFQSHSMTIRNDYKRVIDSIVKSAKYVPSVDFLKDNPDAQNDRDLLAERASELTLRIKAKCFEFYDLLKVKYSKHPFVSTFTDDECLQDRKFLTAYFQTPEEDRSRVMTEDEIEFFGRPTITFWELIEMELRLKPPVSVAPSQVGNSLMVISDEDEDERFYNTKNEDNIHEVFHLLARCYMPFVAFRNQSFLLNMRGKINKDLYKEINELVEQFMTECDELRAEYGLIHNLFHEQDDAIQMDHHFSKMLSDLADHIELEQGDINKIPFGRLHVPQDTLNALVGNLKLNAIKHDNVSEGQKPLSSVSMQILSADKMADWQIDRRKHHVGTDTDKDNFRSMCTVLKNFDENPKEEVICVNYINKGPYFKMTFTGHESGFDADVLRSATMFTSREEGGAGGNGYPNLLDQINQSRCQFEIRNNDDGVAEVSLFIPLYALMD